MKTALAVIAIFLLGFAAGGAVMYVVLPRVSISPEAVILRLKPGAEYSQAQLDWWLKKLNNKSLSIEGK